MASKKSDVSADTSSRAEDGVAEDGVVRLTCRSPFVGPEGAFVAGDVVTVTGETEAEAQARADELVSVLHVARRLPGEAA